MITAATDSRIFQKESIHKSEYLNLPDLQFFLWCKQQYKLNKGIYNTIDAWFYDYGIISITHRRIYVLAFLDFAKKSEFGRDQHKYIRFGSGGLTRALCQFIREIDMSKRIR